MKFIAIAFSLIMSAITPCITYAADGNDVLLTVSGLISNSNSPNKKARTFTFAELQKLGDTTITANTPYDGKSTYTGPLMRAILKDCQVMATAKEVILTGLDGYKVRVPLADFEKFDVVAAHTLNGKRMTVETKGPLWIMYPLDFAPAKVSDSPSTEKLVWNLVSVTVK